MNEVDTNMESTQGGKIVFADDVVATIAYLAAGEVEGVHAMIGTTMEGLTEKLGKKNYTKGVKVEVGAEECTCDITIVVKYGYRIQAVAQKVQEEIKNAIYFEPEPKPEPKPKIKAKAEPEPEPEEVEGEPEPEAEPEPEPEQEPEA